MKISEETLIVLGNMAKLNPHLVIEAGSKIRSINEIGSYIIEVECNETFPVQVALHDLGGFLKVLSIFEEPELTFTDKYVEITDEFASQKYYFSEPDELIYDNDEATQLDFGINFKLEFAKFDRALKAAGVNGVEDIIFVGTDAGIFLEASDKENPTRAFTIQVSEENHGEFRACMRHGKKNKIGVLPMDYDVSICKDGAIRFASDIEEFDLVYLMALEADSEF